MIVHELLERCSTCQWAQAPFESVLEKISCNHKIKQRDYLTNGEIPVIDQGDAFIGGYTNDKNALVVCTPPFIVFGDHTRKVKFVNFIFAPGADGVVVLKSHPCFTPKLAYYFLQALVHFMPDKGYARHFQFLRKSVIPIPPLVEQRAIVAKIGELFSELDKGIEQLQTVKQQLKQYRQAVLKAAFEGKLTAEWREEQHTAGNLPGADQLLEQIKKEREEQYQQQMREWKQAVAEWEAVRGKESSRKKPRKPSKSKKHSPLSVENLPRLPQGWKWVRLDQMGDVGTGSTPRRSNERYWTNGCIPWVASAAVNRPFCDEATDYVTTEALEDTCLRVYPAGTLLLAMYGEGKTRGKVTELRISASINQALAAIVLEGTAARCRSFIKYYLWRAYSHMRTQSSGGVQPNLNLKIVSALAIPCASIPEQEHIVHELESRLSVLDELEKSVSQGLKQAETLRQSILKKAFEGRLLSEAELAAVRNNPEYEPADKLLERIRAEKEPEKQISESQRTCKGTQRKTLSRPQKGVKETVSKAR